MNDYKKYFLRQLGLKEAQFIPTSLLDKGQPKEPSISPTARPTPIIALGIRGSVTGGLPSGADQQGDISPTKVGGYDRVSPQNLNSKLVDKTPSNPDIKQETTPIVDDPQTGETVTHPHQIQVTAHEEPQAATGASTDSDPTLQLKSALPKGIDIDITDEDGVESDEENKNEDNNTAMIPTTSLSETFERHKKLMREKIDLNRECTTCGCGNPHDDHGVGMPTTEAAKEESYSCPKCGKIYTQQELGNSDSRLVCPACHVMVQPSSAPPSMYHGYGDKPNLQEGKHKSGCQCGFCKNKGGFGKKKKDDEKDNQKDTPDFKEKDKEEDSSEDEDKKVDESIKDASNLPDDKVPAWVRTSRERKRKHESDREKPEQQNDKKDTIEKQQRIDESYAAPFQRMRSLAGVGNMILTSNGLMENKNDPGASKPFNTNWKMDKEKAGFVKIDEEKLNKIKATLERKSKRGSLSDKELELANKLTEVLKRRSAKS